MRVIEMKFPALLSVILILAFPMVARAGWLCGSDVSEFTRLRTSEALHGVFVSDKYIIMEGQDFSRVKERVDDYKAKVVEMKAWAAALSDSCLRDAYLDNLKTHERIVDEDYRALEFMKTPQPFAPNS